MKVFAIEGRMIGFMVPDYFVRAYRSVTSGLIRYFTLWNFFLESLKFKGSSNISFGFGMRIGSYISRMTVLYWFWIAEVLYPKFVASLVSEFYFSIRLRSCDFLWNMFIPDWSFAVSFSSPDSSYSSRKAKFRAFCLSYSIYSSSLISLTISEVTELT